MAHTIFTEPQIAGVGATEEDLNDEDTEYIVGRTDYADSAMGRAKKLDHGFVKVLATPDGEICVPTPSATRPSRYCTAFLAMRTGATVDDVAGTIHAHPTLSKVIEAAFREVQT